MMELTEWTRLSSAILSDQLDLLSIRGQVLDHSIRPLSEPRGVMVGRARTVRFVSGITPADRDDMLQRYIGFMDGLSAFDIPVLACGWPARYGVWGDVLSTAAQCRGSTGCVTDGFARDILAIRTLNFPLYAAGIGPDDVGGRARIAAIGESVVCAGVTVEDGDLILGDFDGCVVVPRAVEAEVFRKGVEALAKDAATLDEVRNGRLLRDVFARTGVF